jgi:hypothetical protein
MNHYLITLQIAPDVHMHAYLMFAHKRDKNHYTELVADKMLTYCEEKGIHPLEIFLMTELSDGYEVVRGVLTRLFPEAARTYRTAKESHLSVWGMHSDHPDDKKLMALH